MRVNWSAVWRALDPTLTCRRYTVSVMGWSSGYHVCFWWRRNAERFYREVEHTAPFVSLSDEFHIGKQGQALFLRNGGNGESAPPRYVDVDGNPVLQRDSGFCYDARPVR